MKNIREIEEMNATEKEEYLLEEVGSDTNELWEEISQWLPQDTLNEFLEDYIRLHDFCNFEDEEEGDEE